MLTGQEPNVPVRSACPCHNKPLGNSALKAFYLKAQQSDSTEGEQERGYRHGNKELNPASWAAGQLIVEFLQG